MTGLPPPKGIVHRFDKQTGEIFYDVIVKHKGKVLAEENDFTELADAENFYYKHLDKINIQRIEKTNGTIAYRAEFYQGNKSRPLRKTFKTFSEAVRWRTLCREGKILGNSEEKCNMSFADFGMFWLRNEVKAKRSSNTYDVYSICLFKHSFPIIGKIKIKDMKKMDIDMVVTSMDEKNKAPKTINLVLATISRCFQYARINDILKENVMSEYEKLDAQNKRGEFWLEPDIKIFLSYIATSIYYPLFFTALRTGMRKGEILGLQWDMISFENEQVSVTRTKTRKGLQEKTKSKKERFIPMTKDLMVILKKLSVKNKDLSKYVFLNKNNNPVSYQSLNGLFKKMQKEAGVNKILRFHDLRHTFASQYILKKGDIERLQKLLGHSDLKMTQLYAHLNKQHIMESREFIEKLSLE